MCFLTSPSRSWINFSYISGHDGADVSMLLRKPALDTWCYASPPPLPRSVQIYFTTSIYGPLGEKILSLSFYAYCFVEDGLSLYRLEVAFRELPLPFYFYFFSSFSVTILYFISSNLVSRMTVMAVFIYSMSKKVSISKTRRSSWSIWLLSKKLSKLIRAELLILSRT